MLEQRPPSLADEEKLGPSLADHEVFGRPLRGLARGPLGYRWVRGADAWDPLMRCWHPDAPWAETAEGASVGLYDYEQQEIAAIRQARGAASPRPEDPS